jgi:two-component system chemotaxis response regulator CheB
MRIGAVDIIHKPHLRNTGVSDFPTRQLQDAVWAAAHAEVSRLIRRANGTKQPATADLVELDTETLHRVVIAMGASTGGTEALLALLSELPRRMPGIVVTQHMPENFTAAFAQYLNDHCQLQVSEAKEGAPVTPGHAYIAPGNRHMIVRGHTARYRVHVHDGPPVSRHRPSVDELFHSVAKHVGGDAVGIILTGMGDDGADGMLAMRLAGARTIAQDEDSCVVFGMPRVAIERGGVDDVMSLDAMPAALKRIRPHGASRMSGTK